MGPAVGDVAGSDAVVSVAGEVTGVLVVSNALVVPGVLVVSGVVVVSGASVGVDAAAYVLGERAAREVAGEDV
ncbi:hypothetical protein FRACA_1540002 [Frankia canadensis]|uniref:Uncharacterized protein n=1 Tax=Frankia canadensis TaxID=1836972 RepID=A0A2I2KM83_9ACTN|nr:hypothetical protein FRACA_1540002 [Frankia canadensis]SOU54046.1 hypothetical protein FRACA_1540002 [Frankia canadensis]